MLKSAKIKMSPLLALNPPLLHLRVIWGKRVKVVQLIVSAAPVTALANQAVRHVNKNWGCVLCVEDFMGENSLSSAR